MLLESVVRDYISVIIPTYNARHYVHAAVDSALAQTYRDIEVVVVDDGSYDGTCDLLKQKYGGRITYLYKENGGPASARNLGISKSVGRFIAFLDADDMWKPDKLERQLEAFDEQTHLVGCGENTLNDGSVQKITFDDLVLKNRFANSGVLVKRSALEQVGMFDERPEFFAVEDWDMWLRLSKFGALKLLQRNLIMIRVTENSISGPSQAEKMLRHEQTVLRKHLASRPILHARSLSMRYLSAGLAFHESRQNGKAIRSLLLSWATWPAHLFFKQHLGLLFKILFK